MKSASPGESRARRWIVALVVAATVSAPGDRILRADTDSPDAAADAAFLRGQRLDEVLGDLEGAAAAFRAAASAQDPARRARARLRAADALARLGRGDEARALLRALLDDPQSPGEALESDARSALATLDASLPAATASVDPTVAALREERLAAEEESRGLRRRLDEALRTTASVEGLREEIRTKDIALEDLRRRLREAERAARGEAATPTPAEIESARREERERTVFRSTEYARFGRELYMAGRFEEARNFLREAVELDPSNLLARDLLERAGTPRGDREHVVRGILEVLALEEEIRADQVRMEAENLVAGGRDALAAGDATRAVERATEALRRIDAQPSPGEPLSAARRAAALLFEDATRASGTPRTAPAAPPPSTSAPRWLEAVRHLLEEAGSAGESGGASLNLIPLGPVLAAQAAGLPPLPAGDGALRGLDASAEAPIPGSALLAALRGSIEPGAWRAPGAGLEIVGDTLVARGGGRALDALGEAIRVLGEPGERSLPVTARLLVLSPEAVKAALSDASSVPNDLSGARVLDAAGVARLLAAAAGSGGERATAALRVVERRGFTLQIAAEPGSADATAGREPSLRMDAVAWEIGPGRRAAGLTVRIVQESELRSGPPVRQSADIGGVLGEGGGLCVPGLLLPAGGGDAGSVDGGGVGRGVLLFTVGAPAVPAAGSGAARDDLERRLALGDLPGRTVDADGPLSPGAGLDRRAVRAGAIAAWLARRAAGGVEVTLEGGGLLVRGPAPAAEAVAEDLARLAGDREPVAVVVRAFALDAAGEASLLRGLPLETPEGESDLRFTRLTGRRLDEATFLLVGGGTSLLAGDAAPPARAGSAPGGGGPAAAQVAPVLRTEPGRRVALARVEQWTDGSGGGHRRGLEVGIRPWPGDLPGERWISTDLALLPATSREPIRPASVSVALKPGVALLLTGLANPMGTPGRPRLAVLVELR